MLYTPGGRVVYQYWENIPVHFPQVLLHAFVVMPNHVHGIIELQDLADHSGCRSGKPIGAVVRGFKIGVTQWFRQHTDIGQVWQRN